MAMRMIASVRSRSMKRIRLWPIPSRAARKSVTVSGNSNSTIGLSSPLSATMLANSPSLETKWA